MGLGEPVNTLARNLVPRRRDGAGLCKYVFLCQVVTLTSTARLFSNRIRALHTPINLDTLSGLGDLPFLCPSESHGSTAGCQLICVFPIIEGEELCHII